jgi:hypothetical protein
MKENFSYFTIAATVRVNLIHQYGDLYEIINPILALTEL